MPRSYLEPPRPIAALATPPGRSALAVIRTSGPGCLELAAACFSKPERLRAAPGRSLLVGGLLDPRDGRLLDEVVVSVFRPPASPTGEEVVEFSLHGSPAVVRAALEALYAAGFLPALPGEFSFRAFLAGKGDLVRAEAVDELVRAGSDRARAAALGRLEGGLSRRFHGLRAELLGLLAEVEVRLDYAEEDGSPADSLPPGRLEEIRASLARLIAGYGVGRIYRDGLLVALAGRPNAGKSSLFNLLLREERSIVSPEPGTTRDWVEAGLELEGFALRLADTAGLRETSAPVEAEGVARSRRIGEGADILILVVDSCSGLAAEDQALLASRPEAILVWNKVDLPGSLPPPEGAVAMSVREGRGLPELEAALRSRIATLLEAGRTLAERNLKGAGGPPGLDATVLEGCVASERQKELLERAARALDEAARALAEGYPLDALAVDLRDAADAVGEITGELASPELLEEIFSRFCLGK